MNRVIICGNLGGDPELRYTQNQTAVATFNVATTEHGKDGKQLTEWHRVVVWEKLAENCGKYLEKGKKVLVEGRLGTRSWEDKNGVKRSTTEIIAKHVEFLTPKGEGREQGNGSQRRADTSNEDHYTSGSGSDSLDDIPF